MNIRKIIKEEMDEFEWAKETVNDIPPVYAVYYQDDLEGYFTKKAFDRYLSERNSDRKSMGEDPEYEDEYTFRKININW